MKNYIFLFCAFGLMLAACNRRDQKILSLQVSLVHIPDSVQTAYLEEVESNRTLIVDSQSVNKSASSVSFQVATDGKESLYKIVFHEGHQLLLGLSSGAYRISGDYNRLEAVRISGGATPEEIHRFLADITEKSNRIAREQKRLDTLSPLPDMDSLRAVYELQLYTNRNALLSFVLRYARTTKSPAGAVFALSILKNQFEWERAKPIRDSLKIRFPDNPLVLSVLNDTITKVNDSVQNGSTSLKIGDMAPDLVYPDPEGHPKALHDMRGNYVLVDFWASWCAPCREENPNLRKAMQEFGQKNFKIYGVSLDTKLSSWQQAIGKDDITWSQVSDLKGWNSKPAAIYGVEGIPANYLLDPNGRIIAENIRGKALQQTLSKLLHG